MNFFFSYNNDSNQMEGEFRIAFLVVNVVRKLTIYKYAYINIRKFQTIKKPNCINISFEINVKERYNKKNSNKMPNKNKNKRNGIYYFALECREQRGLVGNINEVIGIVYQE